MATAHLGETILFRRFWFAMHPSSVWDAADPPVESPAMSRYCGHLPSFGVESLNGRAITNQDAAFVGMTALEVRGAGTDILEGRGITGTC